MYRIAWRTDRPGAAIGEQASKQASKQGSKKASKQASKQARKHAGKQGSEQAIKQAGKQPEPGDAKPSRESEAVQRCAKSSPALPLRARSEHDRQNRLLELNVGVMFSEGAVDARKRQVWKRIVRCYK